MHGAQESVSPVSGFTIDVVPGELAPIVNYPRMRSTATRFLNQRQIIYGQKKKKARFFFLNQIFFY